MPLDNVSAGQTLDITRKYYTSAVQIILEFGAKLTQVVWRKLVPTDINSADRELNELAYALIVRRRYSAAATLLRFGLHEMKKHGLDVVRKMMAVNYANAEKLSGNRSKAAEILDAEDWSASTEDYRICVSAVRDDVESVIQMMKQVVESGHMKIAAFRDWPVFESVRADPRFVEAFEREFGQKLIIDKETRSPQTGKIDIDEGESSMALDAAEPQNKKTIH